MKPKEAYKWLLEHSREIAYLDSMGSLLGWDQRVTIPRKGHTHRAAQIAALTKLIHARITDPERGEMISVVEGSELIQDSLSAEAVNVREWKRNYERMIKIPERLAVELAQTTSEAESVWQEARPANDWMRFKPHLERILSLKREEAAILSSGDKNYDALLDQFESGATAEGLKPIFKELRESLVLLLDFIKGSSKVPKSSALKFDCPVPVQEKFSRYVVSHLGYDFEGGEDRSHRPPFLHGHRAWRRSHYHALWAGLLFDVPFQHHS